MTNDPVFIVLLLGHILGDYYFQSDELARRREREWRAVILHCVYYFACMAGVFALCVAASEHMLLPLLAAGAAHFVIDALKYAALQSEWVRQRRRSHIFLLDQALHLASLCAIRQFMCQGLAVYGYLTRVPAGWPALPLSLVLAVLIILKPVGVFISQSALAELRKAAPDAADETDETDKTDKSPAPIAEDTANGHADATPSGQAIGYLERVVIFFLLLYGELGAIGFVLTAKSVARFNDIEHDRTKAEYFLIGTLLSVASAFVVTIALGLCGAAKQ